MFDANGLPYIPYIPYVRHIRNVRIEPSLHISEGKEIPEHLLVVGKAGKFGKAKLEVVQIDPHNELVGENTLSKFRRHLTTHKDAHVHLLSRQRGAPIVHPFSGDTVFFEWGCHTNSATRPRSPSEWHV
eukprot:363866-Chlamydomonas_euryale.AAC.1